MRLGVEPGAVTTAAASVRDLAARVAALELGSVGDLVTVGMPRSASAGAGRETVERLCQELAVLAADLAAHADRLCCAAAQYAATEQSVTRHVGSPW